MNQSFEKDVEKINQSNWLLGDKLRPFLNPKKSEQVRAVLAGDAIIKLQGKAKSFTSRQDFLTGIEQYDDSTKLMANLVKWIKNEVGQIKEQDLFGCLNVLKTSSLTDIFNFLNYGWPRLANRKHDYSNSKLNGLDELLSKLAGVKKDDQILDPTSGFQGTWLELLKQNSKQQVTLQEIDPLSASFAYLNTKILSATNCKIYVGDSVTDPQYLDAGRLQLFDKVITFPPVSMPVSSKGIAENRFNRFRYGKVSVKNGDLAFISNAISALNKTGKAVILISDGPLFRKGEYESFRKNLIEQDLVETVISLPQHLLPFSAIATDILIINKNKQDLAGKIQFINGNQEDWLIEPTSSEVNSLSSEAIENIYRLYQTKDAESGKSVVIPNEEYKGSLAVNNYVLPTFVTINNLQYKIHEEGLQSFDSVNLGDLVEIRRGFNLTKKSETPTGKYLAIKVTDLSNHKVQLNKLVRANITTDPDRYLIKQNDVLLSTRGTVGKTALIGHLSEKVVPNANLVVLRAKSKAVNMKWLMLYLGSPLGQFMLKQATSGTAIATISMKDLKQIKVPRLDIAEQNKAVEKFEKNKKQLDRQQKELLKKYHENDYQLYKSMNVQQVLTDKQGSKNGN